MKNLSKLMLVLLLVVCMSLSLFACSLIPGKCDNHVDENKDGKCDVCEAPVQTTPECTHKDANDDGKCDDCAADFTDGCNNHVDRDDDGKCDVAGCTADCNDGCDNHIDPNDDGKCDIVGCTADCNDGCDNHVDADDNGKCDVEGCTEDFTDGCDNHVDADFDHVCDSDDCYEEMGVCADEDKDHACDYGCDKVFGTCADEDKDHACDYGCDKVFGTCADEDKDHACDYGCDKVFGTCADEDKDHACDYGCDKVFGTCADEDKDHVCDYGCDKAFGTKEDKNDDGKCDYCDGAYTDGCDTKDCLDTDGDGFCDNENCDKETDNKPAVPGTSFENAIELTENKEVNNTVSTNGQQLFYKLTASTSGSYEVEFWGAYFNIDVYSEDSLTEAIASWEVSHSGSLTENVEFNEGKVYYVVITYKENYTSYPYLTVSVPEEEVDANGTGFDDAIKLELGTANKGDWNYNTTYLKFVATDAGSYRIALKNAAYYDVSLYTENDLVNAAKTWSLDYNGSLQEIVELEAGKTYYLVLKSNYGYGYELTVSYRPECSEHRDADDNATCDVCGDSYTDGCDKQDCMDANGDGLCDNANCDEPTENKAAGSSFDNALDITVGTAASANITVSGQKVYFKFTAAKDWYNIHLEPGYYSTVTLYDASNTATALITASGSSAASTFDKLIQVTEGKEYYLVIGSSYSSYEYALTLTESSDPFEASAEFAFGETVQNVSFAAKEEKYYVYKATVTGEYVFYVESGSYNASVSVYDAEKKLIATLRGAYDYNVGDWGGYALNKAQALTADETYYIVIASESSYSATLKISFTVPAVSDPENPEQNVCTSHKDADDNGICDNEGCGTAFTDGCDKVDCFDSDNDGKCDNDGCDKTTSNKPGYNADHALDLEEGKEASGSLGYGKKVFYKFTASASSSYRIMMNGASHKIALYAAGDLNTAINSWATDYSVTEIEPVVTLTEGTTYYIVLESTSYYSYKLTVSVKPDCTAHVDEDDDGRCDVCNEKFSDGCDKQDCMDVNNDGLCDNANCDEPTENKAAGSSFDNALDITVGETANASIILEKQKLYFKFTAPAAKLDFNIEGSYPQYAIYSASDTVNALYTASSYSTSIFNTHDFTVGETYYIVVSNYYNYTATYALDLTEWKSPFESAAELTAGATESVNYNGREMYYTYTATATADHRIYINSYYYKATVTVYDADQNVIGEPVVSSYNSSYYYVVDFNQAMTAGETYYVSISINTTYSFTYEMSFTAPAAE